MRILHVVHQYPPDRVGGTELSTQQVARELARRRHEVAVFYRRSAPGSGCAERMEEGVRVWAAWAGVLTPVRRFRAAFGEPALARAFDEVLRAFRPDVVHLQHLMGLPLSIVRSLRCAGIPYVVTLHDYWWVCANAQRITNFHRRPCEGPRAYLNCARCAIARAGTRWGWIAFPALVGLMAERARRLRAILHGASRLIAPSEHIRRWYIARGVPAERIVLLPHGMEGPQADLMPPRSLGLPVRVAYVGGLAWAKGVHVLLEAVQGLEGWIELWVIGDAEAEPEYGAGLRARAGQGVRFWGPLPHENVRLKLREVDVLAVPSLWEEPFARVVSEAFAAGVPVLVSDRGALPERVRDGVDGWVLPAGDVEAWRAALIRLVEDPEALPRLRMGVRPPMTLREHVDRLEALYAEAAGRGGRSIRIMPV